MAGESFRVADRARVERILDRLAARIVAELGSDFAIVGIRRRGVPLAELLAGRIRAQLGREVPVHEITLKRYADDLTLLHDEPELSDEELPAEIRGGTVLLVDDVFYSGRTLLRAVMHVVGAGASRVLCAVLCARGPDEVPVRADFTGLRLDVGPGRIIDVEVPPYESELGITINLQS